MLEALKGEGIFLVLIQLKTGHVVARLVEALRYKPEGCGFGSRWCNLWHELGWYFACQRVAVLSTYTKSSVKGIYACCRWNRLSA